MAAPFADWSFLALLAEQVRRALAALPGDVAVRHVRFLMSLHDGQGGFRGRRGGADLYYTAFAARALHALGAFEAGGSRAAEVPDGLAQSIAGFAVAQRPASILDALNVLATHAIVGAPLGSARAMLGWVERFRVASGGYRNAAAGPEESLYHTFLAALCYDLVGERPPDAESLAAAALRHRQPDGGFSETLAHPRGSCNPTAAGLSLLTLLGGLDATVAESAAVWLRALQTDDGGWLAAPGAPVADLLSTYTAVTALAQMDRFERRELAPVLRFVQTCQGPSGAGFSAGPWDGVADAEYTAYGLGLVALAL